jgi:hypothetical protein
MNGPIPANLYKYTAIYGWAHLYETMQFAMGPLCKNAILGPVGRLCNMYKMSLMAYVIWAHPTIYI